MEDVQYALQQGTAVEQSFLMVLDSAMRDHAAYPTPSEYYMPFPVPLRTVFAVDLVDATIPRTEYTIESYSNTLYYAAGTSFQTYEQALLADELVRVALQPGDYNVAQLIEALNSALASAGLAKGHVPVRVESVGDPVDITNKLKFTRPEPFVVFMGQTTLRKAIGFGNASTTPGAMVAWDGSARFSTDTSVSNDIFQSVAVTAAAPTPAFAGPVPVELTEYTYSLPAGSALRQSFTAGVSGILAGITLKGTASANASITVSVYLGTTTLLATTTLSAVSGAAGWTASFSSGEGIPILAGTGYSVTLRQTTSQTVTIYKAETFSDDAANKIETSPDAGSTWTVSSALDALCFDLGVAVAGFKVEAPGQCCLTGERYVLVRSPDIEQYMHRDLAAAFDRMAPGMGLLKLGGLGYREERFNFLAYQTRRFHPIGKLKGLRIRLETRSGRLYDAHGIDHTLLVCVKMYAPGPSRVIPRDLFPGYTPDLHLAVTRKLDQERRK